MRTASKSLATAVLLGVLAGCVQYTLVEPKRQIAMERFSVEPTSAWNRRKAENTEQWTKDGMGLQTLHFFDEISDGDVLFELYGEEELPTFASNMRASDVVDLMVATMTARGVSAVEADNLRPFAFGDLDGFTFDLAMTGANGGRFKGKAYGAIDDGKLYLILYTGNAEYYFDKEKGAVEEIINSLTL